MDYLSEPTLLVALIEVVVGIALLTRAADTFVDGAVGLAHAARVSPVLVGAVIVGFGTSAPELLVSGIAALEGDLALGVGNIVGSNVANLSLVLGAAAMIVPLLVSRSILIREAPLSLLAVLMFAYFTTRGGLRRWEGVVMLVALVGALGWVIVGGMGTEPEFPRRRVFGLGGTVLSHSVETVVGLIGTIAGAQVLVWGARAVAERVGLSGGFIGFTLVAVGTSLPELVTAVAAARKRQTELILGNLLGSNIFNSLAVGGVIALVGPGPIDDPGLRSIGVVVMVLVALAAWFAMATLRRVHKLEAAVLLAGWTVAVVLLARTATEELAGL